MKLPMNAAIYSIGFVFDPLWRRIVGGATGTRATIIKWPLGGLSNLFIFISATIHDNMHIFARIGSMTFAVKDVERRGC